MYIQMKKLSLFVTFLLGVCTLKAQQRVTGNITYQQILNYKGAFPDTIAGKLYFSPNKSVYTYDQNTNKLPKEGTVNNASGAPMKSVFKGRQTDSIGKVVYADFNRKIFVTREVFQGQNFIVPDSVPHIAWKMENEHKTIAKQECSKASGIFRGREYEVWYTEDIPVGFGPWKLCGLPGVILEARSKDGEVTFIAERIMLPAAPGQAIKAPVKGQPMSDFKAFYQLQNKKALQYASFLQSNNASTEVGASVRVTPRINRIEKAL
jgi:GLPGLI family protein